MCHNLNAMTFMTPSARGAQSDAYDRPNETFRIRVQVGRKR